MSRSEDVYDEKRVIALMLSGFWKEYPQDVISSLMKARNTFSIDSERVDADFFDPKRIFRVTNTHPASDSKIPQGLPFRSNAVQSQPTPNMSSHDEVSTSGNYNSPLDESGNNHPTVSDALALPLAVPPVPRSENEAAVGSADTDKNENGTKGTEDTEDIEGILPSCWETRGSAENKKQQIEIITLKFQQDLLNHAEERNAKAVLRDILSYGVQEALVRGDKRSNVPKYAWEIYWHTRWMETGYHREEAIPLPPCMIEKIKKTRNIEADAPCSSSDI
jgi:hypothetical protein